MMTVVVYGDRLDLADELREQFHPQARDAVSELADMAIAEVQRRLSLRSGTAQTAAPEGEPPEKDTGGLLMSFKKIPPRVDGRVAQSGFKTAHPGASRLEFGFTDVRGIRTFPHPFMAPAMAAIESAVVARLSEIFT